MIPPFGLYLVSLYTFIGLTNMNQKLQAFSVIKYICIQLSLSLNVNTLMLEVLRTASTNIVRGNLTVASDVVLEGRQTL